MASRWAYEALAVTQFRKNKYEKPFFWLNHKNSEATWKRDYWLPELRNQLDFITNYSNDSTLKEEVEYAYKTLSNEITKEEKLYNPADNFVCDGCHELIASRSITNDSKEPLILYFKQLREIYKQEANQALKAINDKVVELGPDTVMYLKKMYFNDALSDFATNRNDLTKIINYENKLIQKSDPIYKIPKNSSFFNAHFYAPVKVAFGQKIDTMIANITVIWLMTALLTITLYFDLFRILIEGVTKLTLRFKR
jgi:hypothetical protein